MDVKLSEGMQLRPDGMPCNDSTKLPKQWAKAYPAIPPLELALFLAQHEHVEVLTTVASVAASRLHWTEIPSLLSYPNTKVYVHPAHEGWNVYGMRGEPL